MLSVRLVAHLFYLLCKTDGTSQRQTTLAIRWDRFDYYARRIKKMFFDEDDLCETTVTLANQHFTCRQLKEKPSSPLYLPSLQNLEVHSASQEGMQFVLHHLLSPSVIQLNWTIHCPFSKPHVFNTVDHLSTTCLNVRDVTLGWLRANEYLPKGAEGWTQALGDFAVSLPHLQSLRLTRGALSFQHLAQLSQSEIQEIAWPSPAKWAGEVDLYTTPFFPGGFQNLRCLDGVFNETRLLMRLLKEPSLSKGLEKLVLSVKGSTHYEEQEIKEYLAWVAGHHTTLKIFQTTLHSDQPSFYRYQHLRTLGRCKQLTELKFTYDGTMLLVDSELQNIVVGLSNLEKIVLMPYRFDIHTSPPSLTLKSFETLQLCCPKIREIDMYVDAEVRDGVMLQELVDPVAFRANPLANLSSVGFGLSPIQDAGSVMIAKFLRSLTSQPSLNMITIWSSIAPNYFEYKRRKVMWEKVARLIADRNLPWIE